MASAPQVILVRHGSTAWNRGGVGKDRIRGHADIPLDARGRSETTTLTKQLTREPIDTIATSDLKRATATARSLADGHPQATMTATPTLRSWNLGYLHGKTVDQSVIQEIRRYVMQPDLEPVGGESYQAYAKRFLSAFGRILDTAKGTVVVVTHARGLQLARLWLDSGRDRMELLHRHLDELASEPDTVKPGGFIRLVKRGDHWAVAETFKPQAQKQEVS